jgi:hypothetical protein
MGRLGRAAHFLGITSIPVAGVVWRDWSEATALAFYWCDTALIVLFVAIRLAVHRRLTNKRGHYVEKKWSVNGGPLRTGVTTYNVSFLTTAIGFSVGNLVFLAVLLGLFGSVVGGGEIDFEVLKRALLIALAILTLGLALDVPSIGARPFMWVRLQAEAALWRVFVVYIAIFIGMFCAILLSMPHAIFSVFVALRLFTDIGSNFKQYDPERPPAWVRRFVKNRAQFEEEWGAERVTRLQAEAADEEPFDGRPSTTSKVGSITTS